MSKISIIGQIAEIKREIKDRDQRFEQLIRSGKMRREEAEMLMQRIHAVLTTLEFCQHHKPAIEEYMAAKKAGKA
jgi:hypothetical protein